MKLNIKHMEWTYLTTNNKFHTSVTCMKHTKNIQACFLFVENLDERPLGPLPPFLLCLKG